VTARTNVQRGFAAKINFEIAEKIREEYASDKNMTQQKLADKYGLFRTSISFIIRGVNWARSEEEIASNVTNNRRKLFSTAQVKEIINLLDKGRTQSSIASEFGCTQYTIWKIKAGKY